VQVVREGICRGFLLLSGLSALLLVSNTAMAQQSIAENIARVGHVCLAGQPCVGTQVGAQVGAQVGVQTGAEAATQVDSNAVNAAQPTARSETVASPAATTAVADSAPAAPAFDAAASYQMSCFACHASGAAGAPVVGEPEAWSERMEKGMDAVMANVVNGLNAMPPRGLCVDCSDDNLRAMVDYMLEQ
jgi:cytochrome c5